MTEFVREKNYLNEPLELPCGVVIPNRLAKSAMTEGLADGDNHPTPELVRLYNAWAQGGVGLSLTGNVMVDRNHLERPGNVAITSRTVLPVHRRWAASGTSHGGQFWMQIGHAGRQTPKYVNTSPKSACASKLSIAGQFGESQAYGHGELLQLVTRFADAAWVAKKSGFSGVQIHAAHGFLLSEFLSPMLNQRTDQWGGSLKNRARLLLDIIDATRAVVGADYPISVKLNSEDFQKGGFTLDECLVVVRWLGEAKVDLLEVTGGSYEQPQMIGHGGIGDDGYKAGEERVSQRTLQREAYFLQYAKIIRTVARMPVMVTGGFRSRAFMQEALKNKELDIIGLARPMVLDPGLPRKLLLRQTESAVSMEKVWASKPQLLGARSPFFLVRLINIQGQQGWFYYQLKRLARGHKINPHMGLLRGLVSHLVGERMAASKLAHCKP